MPRMTTTTRRQMLQRRFDEDGGSSYYIVDPGADTITPYTGDPRAIKTEMVEGGGDQGGASPMYYVDQQQQTPDPSYAWAEAHGLVPVLEAVEAKQKNGTPIPDNIQQWMDSVAGRDGDQWSNVVRQIQHQEDPGSGWNFKDFAKNPVGFATDKAKELTGNPLGVPGFDPGVLKGEPAPVTQAAIVAGLTLLGANALSGAGTISELSAANSSADVLSGAGDAFGSGAAYEEGAGNLAAQTLTGSSPAGTSLAENIGGVSKNAGQMLVADAGNTMTDVGPGLLNTPAADVTAGAGDMFGGGEVYDAGTSYMAPPAEKGLLSSFSGLSQPVQYGLVAGGLQVGGGILKGIGDRSTALEIADKKAQTDKELLEQKRIQDEKAAEDKRARVQSGSYFDANIPIKAKKGAVLRRPDGTPVYSGPLLFSPVR